MINIRFALAVTVVLFVASHGFAWSDSAPAMHAALKPPGKIAKSITTALPRSVAEGLWPDHVDEVLAPLDHDQLRLEDAGVTLKRKTTRTGVIRSMSDLKLTASKSARGRWVNLSDGRRAWQVVIKSEGAVGLRVRISDIQLPVGAVISVFDAKDPMIIHGPFDASIWTSMNEFWTPTLFSETAVLEFILPASSKPDGAGVTMNKIVHHYRDPREQYQKEGACHTSIACFPEWKTTGLAVAGIGSITEYGAIWCSGSLLNDSDTSTWIDYFLTANHCVENQAIADTTEYYWFYERSSCYGANPWIGFSELTAGGANYLAGQDEWSGNDFALLRLRTPSPDGVVYTGWTTELPDYLQNVSGIHHPDGTHKRISSGSITGADENYWDVLWYNGATEPGSSGSPLFNQAKQVIGHLYGGDSFCGFPGGIDWYGRFDVTYQTIAPWLKNLRAGAAAGINRKAKRDFDGDGRSDYGAYHPPSGTWLRMMSKTGYEVSRFGFEGTMPIAGDWDGDGKADYGCYHPPSGMWYRMMSKSGFSTTQFGFGGTIPIVGDWDGDGKDDYGCYHPPSGMWYRMMSKSGFSTTKFGFGGTIPIVGDWDSDGKDDYGCYHPPSGMWYRMMSKAGFATRQFGFEGTIPIVGDWDGDGKDDFGCYHPPSGTWYRMMSREGFRTTQFGFGGTTPVVGDWDGDGRDDYGCYHPPSGMWYRMMSANGFQVSQFGFDGTGPL